MWGGWRGGTRQEKGKGSPSLEDSSFCQDLGPSVLYIFLPHCGCFVLLMNGRLSSIVYLSHLRANAAVSFMNYEGRRVNTVLVNKNNDKQLS
jgi:hypothetical protein